MSFLKIHIYLILVLIGITFIIPQRGVAQDQVIDSINAIVSEKKGEAYIDAFGDEVFKLVESDKLTNPKSLYHLLQVAKSLHYYKGIAKSYYLFGQYYSNKGMLDSAAFYLHKSDTIARAKKMDFEQVQTNGLLAEIAFDQQNHDKYFQLAQEAIDLAKKNNFQDELAVLHANMGKYYDTKQVYDSSLFYYYKAIEYFEPRNNFKQLATLYNNVGGLQTTLKNYAKAKELLEKGVEIALKSEYLKALFLLYSNLAVVYKQQNEFEQARSYQEKALQLAKRLQYVDNLATIYANIGSLYSNENQFRLAKQYYDSSLIICEQTGLAYGVMLNNLNIGLAYLHLQEEDSALIYLKEAETLAKKFESYQLQVVIYEAIHQAFKTKDLFEPALEYLHLSKRINDSLMSSEREQQILELQYKYENALEKQQVLELESQLLQRQSQNRYYVILILIIFSIAIVISAYYIIKQRKTNYLKQQAELMLRNAHAELAYKKRELVNNTMQLSQMLEKIKNADETLLKISISQPNDKDQMIEEARKYLKNINPGTSWNEFERRFQEVFPEFTKNLLENHPDLSPNELRICSLLRLSLSSKEISALTNRSVRTVENTRFLIRKKLGLGSENNLISYLLSI